MGIRAGTVLVELRGKTCVLQSSRGLIEVQGVGYDILRRALASVGREGCKRFAIQLQNEGVDAPDSHLLASVFQKQAVFGDCATSIHSVGSLQRHFNLRARRIGLRIGLLRLSDLAPGKSSPLLQVHAKGWRLSTHDCCLECAALWEIQSDGSPDEAANIASALPRRTAIALSATNLEAIEVVLRGKSLGDQDWIAGKYGVASAYLRRQRIAVGCSRCARLSKPLGVKGRDRCEVTARRVIQRLGIAIHEKTVRTPSRRAPSILRVAWGIAFRRNLNKRRFHGHFAAQLGVGSSERQRLITGRAEVIERACAVLRHPDIRTTSARQLKHAYLPLEQWALYTAEQYASEAFPFRPVSRDTPIDWLWAEDLSTGQRLLVPAAFTMSARLSMERFVSSSSNGVATHTSPEAAIRSALLEVIERDALQIAWYSGRKTIPLDPRRIRICREFRSHLDREGWSLRFGWLQGRAQIVVAAVLAEMQAARGRFPRGATILCSAAAGSIREAAQRAVRELVMVTEALTLRSDLPDGRPFAEAAPALDKFWSVGTLTDINFLYLNPRMHPVASAFFAGARTRDPTGDISDDATSIVKRLRQEGRRALAIDLSLTTAKPFVTYQTIITDTQPLAFGTGVLRLGSGLLPCRLPPRCPPLPGSDYRSTPGRLNPYILPLA